MHAVYTRQSIADVNVLHWKLRRTFPTTSTDRSFSRSLFADLIRAEGNSSSVSINQGTTFITGPYLEGNGISNVTSQIGTSAFLACKVSTQILPSSQHKDSKLKLLCTTSNERTLLLKNFSINFYCFARHRSWQKKSWKSMTINFNWRENISAWAMLCCWWYK